MTLIDPHGKPSASLWAKIGRVLRRYRRLHRTSFELYQNDLKALPAQDMSVEARLLQAGEDDLLTQVGPLPLSDIRRRLADGDSCYVCLADGRLAGYTWVRTRGEHNLVVTGHMLPVQARECWFYTAWVAEWARGRKLYRAMLLHALRDMASRGYERAWAEVELANEPARRPLQQTGWKVNHQFRVLGLGPHLMLQGFDADFRKRAAQPTAS